MAGIGVREGPSLSAQGRKPMGGVWEVGDKGIYARDSRVRSWEELVGCGIE